MLTFEQCERMRQLCADFLHRLPDFKPVPAENPVEIEITSEEGNAVKSAFLNDLLPFDCPSSSWEPCLENSVLWEDYDNLQLLTVIPDPQTQDCDVTSASPMPNLQFLNGDRHQHPEIQNINPMDLHVFGPKPPFVWESQSDSFPTTTLSSTTIDIPQQIPELESIFRSENLLNNAPALEIPGRTQQISELESTLSVDPADDLMRASANCDFEIMNTLEIPHLPSGFNPQVNTDLDRCLFPDSLYPDSSQDSLMDMLERENQMDIAEFPFKDKNSGNRLLQQSWTGNPSEIYINKYK